MAPERGQLRSFLFLKAGRTLGGLEISFVTCGPSCSVQKSFIDHSLRADDPSSDPDFKKN
jgi:hypothetical protein